MVAFLYLSTTVVVAIVRGSVSAVSGQRRCGAFVFGDPPFLVSLTAYNYDSGHPFAFGQSLVASSIALSKTGLADLWQSSWSVSLPGLQISPAHGLPVSSQALWQHPASTFFLSLAAWLLLRSESRPLAAAWCGAALGMAMLCRPTTAVVVVCTGAYLLWVDRRPSAAFVFGGLAFLVETGRVSDPPSAFLGTPGSAIEWTPGRH